MASNNLYRKLRLTMNLTVHEHEELLDVVDLSDQVIGQKYRTEIYAEKSAQFRVINAFLINSKKQVWIPRRSQHKKLFPLCLDTSVGGHVAAGESYDQAFVRELKEELNLEAGLVAHKFVAKLTPQQHNVSAYMHLYIIITDDDPAYNTDDFISARWFTLDELQTLIKQGEPTKGDLPTLINLLQEHL